MANPQLENGYTKIANEIMDALIRCRIPGEVRQIVDAILRKTFGWQKSRDKITLSQFYLMTGMKKPSIIRALHKANEHKIIYKSANDSYLFNKDYTVWKPFTKKLTISKRANDVSKRVNQCLHKGKSLNTKETITKETITKENIQKKKESFSNFATLWEKYPKKDGRKEALKHFLSSVKTEEDLSNIKTAVNNYLKFIQAEKTEPKYIKNGSTFFNNWEDWITPRKTKSHWASVSGD